MPRSTRFRRGRQPPSRVRNVGAAGRADHRAAALQDAADVGQDSAADAVAALDQALVALGDRVHVDARGASAVRTTARRAAFIPRVATAGEHGDGGWL